MSHAASDERTVQRLEAFSDIVIGFSLAQLGASLAFTKPAMTLDAGGVAAFIISFAIVCSLWYFHHRLFERFFVPTALPIVLNFVWLANVVLLVFVSVHSAGTGFAERNPTLLYFGLYGLAYAILAVQTALGMRERPAADPALRLKGIGNICFMTYWALVFCAAFALVDQMPWSNSIGGDLSMTFGIGAAGSILMSIYFRRKKAALTNA